MPSIEIRFIFSGTEDDKPVWTNMQGRFKYSFDTSATHEEIIHLLIQRQYLLPLDNPHLHYNMSLRGIDPTIFSNQMDREIKLRLTHSPESFESSEAFNESLESIIARIVEAQSPAILREGQTLASTNLIKSNREYLLCVISTETKAFPPPKKKPSNSSPSLGETIIADLTSQEATAVANLITIATGFAAFIGVLRHVAKHWSEKDGTDSATMRKHPLETDIVTIRLRMTHGDDHQFEEWLTAPDKLKHYIDVFNQPSSSIQPLQAIFVQRSGKAIKVDVSKGSQNNPQLDGLLSYLNIDNEQK